MSAATGLRCSDCANTHPLDYLLACPDCGGLLFVEYDLDRVARMPFGNLSGPGISARILEHQPDIKILLMTGYADRDRHGDGGEANRFPCLMKPFTREDLARRVRRLIDGAGWEN